MKKILIPLLLCLALPLTGCGGRAARSRFDSFRQTLLEREALSFQARLRCEYPDRRLEFDLAYEMDEEGETVTVLAPELIRGVSAHLSPGGSRLEYEGLMLDTGDLSPYGLTPLSALPRLVASLRDGHVESQWEEDGQPVLELLLDDHSAATVRFSADGMIPVHAELAEDGSVRAFCEIIDWS